jgi:hypothetical protein
VDAAEEGAVAAVVWLKGVFSTRLLHGRQSPLAPADTAQKMRNPASERQSTMSFCPRRPHPGAPSAVVLDPPVAPGSDVATRGDFFMATDSIYGDGDWHGDACGPCDATPPLRHERSARKQRRQGAVRQVCPASGG